MFKNTIKLKNHKRIFSQDKKKTLSSNKVKTTMYTIFTFLPHSLYNQLKQFTNIYFLFLSILSWFPQISTLNPYSVFVAIAFILIFSMAFDWYQDLKRYFSDKKVNNKKIKVIRDGKIIFLKSKNVFLGDLLFLEDGDSVMADIVLLSYKNDVGYCYIDTSTLDGEKTLKPKISVLDCNLDIGCFLIDKNAEGSKIRIEGNNGLRKDKEVYKEGLLEHKNSDEINNLVKKIDSLKINGIIFPDFLINLKENEANLYKFRAEIKYSKFQKSELIKIEKMLDINNFIPRSSIIRNSNQVIGLVSYIGKNTKLMKNTQKRIFKLSSLEKNMNFYIFIVAFFLFIALIILSILELIQNQKFNFKREILEKDNNDTLNFIYSIFASLLLLNSFVPVSLIVTLQFIKLIHNGLFLMNNEYKDKKSNKKSDIKTFNISEELGAIEYILSDKTGTLTENKMIAKYFQINNFQKKLFDFDENDNLNNNIDENDNLNSNMDEDSKNPTLIYTKKKIIVSKIKNGNNNKKNNSKKDFKNIILESDDKREKYVIKSQEQLNDLFYLNINTCHNCFSKIKPKLKTNKYSELKKKIKYEGPSPDEIALLNGTKNYCDYLLKNSTQNEIIIIKKKDNKKLKIEKISNFEFDSNRKMMSVIVKINNNIFQMVKGADNSLIEKSINNLSTNFQENCDLYLDKGFRIMFTAIRLISESELEDYKKKLYEAQKKEEEEIYKIKKEFEKNLVIIGATAIEDKLQEGVKDTIKYLKKAGIKIWVITGDKMETALNIAKSTNLFEKDEEPMYVTNEKELDYLINFSDNLVYKKQDSFLWRFEKVPNNGSVRNISLQNIQNSNTSNPPNLKKDKKKQNLIINGQILNKAIKSHKKKFQQILLTKNCVVFSRTNANQKVQILRLLKELKIKTLAIGDGANDVNMIQESTVGIGIIGEEGKQAENSSDFSIPKFKYLKPLILKHGRLSYYRLSQMILYYYYKNFLYTMPQIYFAFRNNFSRQVFFKDFYMSAHNLIFTVLGGSSRAIQDIDINDKEVYYKKNLLLECGIYFYGVNNVNFNAKKFFFWVLTGILESLYIFFMIFFFLEENIYFEDKVADYQVISLIVFSVIFFYENLKFFWITSNWGLLNILGLFLSFLSFFFYLFATDKSEIFGYINGISVSYEISNFYIYVLFLIFTLLIFNQTFYILKRYIFPSIKDKIRALKTNVKDDKLEILLCNWKITFNKKSFAKFLFN